MERVQKAQALNNEVNEFSKTKRIMELNPNHPLIQKMLNSVKSFVSTERNKNPIEEDHAFLLYQSAAATSGFTIDDTSKLAEKMQRVLRRSMGVDLEAKVQEWEVVLPPEGEDIPTTDSAKKKDTDDDIDTDLDLDADKKEDAKETEEDARKDDL